VDFLSFPSSDLLLYVQYVFLDITQVLLECQELGFQRDKLGFQRLFHGENLLCGLPPGLRCASQPEFPLIIEEFSGTIHGWVGSASAGSSYASLVGASNPRPGGSDAGKERFDRP
jgi:hypothetical protein